MNTEDRKQQIVQAALGAIGEYGVQGATISRIARGAGITPAALYSHFQNRRAILVAALEEVYKNIADSFGASPDDDPIDQFNRIFESHAEKVLSQDKTSHAHLFLEFVASAPEEGLREVLREKELETNAYLTSVVTELQEKGRLPQAVDAETIAWLVAGWAWTGNVANLMDLTTTWDEKVSPLLREFIREGIFGGARVSAHKPGSLLPPLQSTVNPSETASAEAPAESVARAPLDGLPGGTVFTVEEAAGMLKVSTDIIFTMVREGLIRAVYLGSEMRVPRRALLALLRGTSEDALEVLLEERTVQAPPARAIQ